MDAKKALHVVEYYCQSGKTNWDRLPADVRGAIEKSGLDGEVQDYMSTMYEAYNYDDEDASETAADLMHQMLKSVR